MKTFPLKAVLFILGWFTYLPFSRTVSLLIDKTIVRLEA